MAQTPNEQDPPLPLWGVLEEEFRELHVGGSAHDWQQRWQAEQDRITRRTGKAPTPAELEDALHHLTHELPEDEARTALCLSGGGIRSAAFGLGVLQGLARKRLLARMHYLSTVSGGGYIGAWLSSWIHRHIDGVRGTESELAASVTSPADTTSTAHPVQQLRRYSNYLSPRVGLMSPDTWTLVATFFRNLLANWLVLLPLLLLLLLVPRVMLSMAGWPWFSHATVAPWLLYLIVAAAWVAALFAVKYSHDVDELPSGEGTLAAWAAEATGEFLRECLLPVIASALLLVTALAWYRASDLPVRLELGQAALPLLPLAAALFGGTVHYAGWLWSTEPATGLRDHFAIVFSGLLAGLVGGLAAQMALRLPEQPTWLVAYVWLAPALLLGLFVLGANLHAAWAGIKNRTTDADMEWSARMTGYLLRSACIWLLASGVVFYGPILFDILPRLVSLSGVVALFGGSVVSGWSGSTESGRRSEQSDRRSRVLDLITRFAGPVFLAVILAWLSALTSLLVAPLREVAGLSWAWAGVLSPETIGLSWKGELLVGLFGHLRVLIELTLAGVLALGAVLGAIFLFAARNVALNKFSLHHMYRERLIRAFLGANRPTRRPDRFTGFDPDDNLPMGHLWPLALTPQGIVDQPGFLTSVRDGTEPVLRALRQRLTPALQTWLGGWGGGADTEQPLIALCFEWNGLAEPLGFGPGDQLGREHLPPTLLAAWAEFEKQVRQCRKRGETRVGFDQYQVRLYNRTLLESVCSETIRGARRGHGSRPLHLLNLTLNLASDPELAWQDRKGESFTVSPLHAGAGDPTLGYRRTDLPTALPERRYGGDRGISLGTAMAISGAAASPNMGYHSSPVVTFLLTLFNARLGWWLGNPGAAGAATYPDYYVRRPVRWLLRELRGRTDRTGEYVYLSDGGHFENLGLYEAVRRRARFIIVSDAGADPAFSFEDLGNAIRKIRIDFGIPITFPSGLPIYSRREAAAADFTVEQGRHYALATIHYSEVDRRPDGTPHQDGLLLYLKPAVYGQEPVDVRNYATKHRDFPHETTADQWFSEPQLESYRALGLYAIEQALARAQPTDSVGGALRRVDHPEGRHSGAWRRAL